jgi:hypothetical protein
MNHPHLSELFKIYQSESQPFRKVHRMIDLFESLIKMHTVIIISEYVKQNKLSDTAKGMLSQGLRTPSLGTWQLFSRILFEELQQDGYSWTFTDFPNAFAALDKALNAAKTNVVSFRNGYAHGATPTDEQCESDIKQFEPFLLQLLESKWLTATSLVQRDNKVWVTSETNELCLHPILLYKEEAGLSPYAFFNDLKNDKVGLLNYPISKHYREKQFFQEFHQYLPLNDWKKTGNNEFYQRIEELTETFKGRTVEREKLLQFVLENNKGYFSIQGNPGIGKSALIAQFFKDLKSYKEVQSLQVVEFFIRRGTAQAQVEYVFNYLIRRTDELFQAGREIRAEGKAVWELQQQLFSKWRLWGEQNKGSKLLFLIDGLDEGVENNVVSYLPRENFEGILIIYGSRPGGHKSIDELWSQLPVEHHTKLELSGLGKADIRALIYEVANKYELDRESAWIDAVQQRSQGNPLYLKLLCDAMENGSFALNDIQALPEKIDEYYKAILDRYAADPMDGDALLNALYAFAAAKDYLTMAHIGLVNNLGEATLQRIGSTLKEVLYENPLTEEVLDYQLFHESFREYLVKEKTKQVNEAAERIIDFCTGWKELEGTWEQRYSLEHYAAHLSESKKEARVEILSKLIYDHTYTRTQKKVLKGFDASNAMYRLALKKACELKKEDDKLEAALSLVDLKYEEANDAPQVVAMVANGDIDFALKRIESFGGADEEGMKRKFILYMLCLMELTLLDSKDKPFRKEANEKLLNHLDDELPTDYSILNWENFFPTYLMFLMASEWAEMELDYLRVYKRTKSIYRNLMWIPEKGPYSQLQFEILKKYALVPRALYAISTEQAKQGKFEESLESARGIKEDNEKSNAFCVISTELAKHGKLEEGAYLMQESLECARSISDDEEKSNALSVISSELARQGKRKEADSIILESLECARGISRKSSRNYPFEVISIELAKQGKFEESLECARGISDDWNKSIALRVISSELARQGKLKESLECAWGIRVGYDKCIALADISMELAKQKKLLESDSIMNESLNCTFSIRDDFEKNGALITIAREAAKHGKLEKSLECARVISNAFEKSKAFCVISTELAKHGKLEEGAYIMHETLECARSIISKSDKSEALTEICSELSKQGKLEEASSVMQELLECTRGVSEDSEKSLILVDISIELAKQMRLKEADSFLKESLEFARDLRSSWQKIEALAAISFELLRQGKLNESLECARFNNNDREEGDAIRGITIELTKQGKLEDALEIAMNISNHFAKTEALKNISTELAKQGEFQAAFECAHRISSDYSAKNGALSAICSELAKQGKIEESLECAHGISSDSQKSQALSAICSELAKQDRIEESLECAQGISDDMKKIEALISISTEIAKRGKIEQADSLMRESLECARGISDSRDKSVALSSISSELATQGKIEESLECARGISEDGIKSDALAEISLELAKKGDWQFAEKTAFEITLIAERHMCWKSISQSFNYNNGWQSALDKYNFLNSDEANVFYLKGLVEDANLNNIDFLCLKDSLPFFIGDSDSIEKLLQAYSQHEIFFNKPSKEKINRLNKTLNIQWALDIIAKFPKEEIQARLSSNLTDWIDQIPDEDDRDEIELLVRKVAKGKMSEEEFGERLKELIT